MAVTSAKSDEAIRRRALRRRRGVRIITGCQAVVPRRRLRAFSLQASAKTATSAHRAPSVRAGVASTEHLPICWHLLKVGPTLSARRLEWSVGQSAYAPSGSRIQANLSMKTDGPLGIFEAA